VFDKEQFWEHEWEELFIVVFKQFCKTKWYLKHINLHGKTKATLSV
jgi:hypothetical protein